MPSTSDNDSHSLDVASRITARSQRDDEILIQLHTAIKESDEHVLAHSDGQHFKWQDDLHYCYGYFLGRLS